MALYLGSNKVAGNLVTQSKIDVLNTAKISTKGEHGIGGITTDYDFILIIAGGSNGSYSKASCLIPTSGITYNNINDTYAVSVIQSTSVFFQIEFNFKSTSVINVANINSIAWSTPAIVGIYGIKL